MGRQSFGKTIFAVALSALLCGCSSPAPSHADAWLSWKYETGGPGCGPYAYLANNQQPSASCPGLSDFNEALNYYEDIGAPATLAQWKAQYGFPAAGDPPAHAVYVNFRDLRIGRDMNCVQNTQTGQVACYVTNFGPGPACAQGVDSQCGYPNLEQAAEGAITGAVTDASPPPTAQITSISLTCNGGVLDNAAFSATNSFSAGQTVQVTGLSAGTFLNNQILPVSSTGLSNSQFEAGPPNDDTACPGGSVSAATGGTATFFNTNILATVAMVYSGTPNSNTPTIVQQNNITFYVYDQFGNLATNAILDDEGQKSVPRMCMACHGGTYQEHTSTQSAAVYGASFLPFDVPSFYYSTQIHGYGEGNQQEGFRQLNLLVKGTNGGNQPQTPNQIAIVDFINGLYCPDTVNGGVLADCPTPVENAGSAASDSYFPSGWAGNQKLYSEVDKPYCRMCHMAQPAPATFFHYSDTVGLVAAVQSYVCGNNDMPQAEVPFGGPLGSADNPFGATNDHTVFWFDSVAQNDLENFLKSNGLSGSCQ